MKDLKQLSTEIYENAKSKGFWDEPADIPRLLMLTVSELSEALEADRIGFSSLEHLETLENEQDPQDFANLFEALIKGSFEEEIADAFIRILDLSEGLSIPLQRYVELKIRYNKMRPVKHGKKY